MPIIQAGSTNIQSLIVPDVYVNIIPPSVALLNGVPTNIVGIVGTAAWGPVNVATSVSSYASYASIFGPVQARLYDAGTQVATAVQQGCQAMQIVRVTDGTDVAATVQIDTNCISVTSIYTGSYGNNTSVIIAPSSVGSAWNVTVTIPGLLSEVFSNISGTGNAFWQNVASAINNGQSAFRGPSQLATATAGAGTTAPPSTATTYTLAGGTDGVTSITSSVMVGVNGTTTTGMYALQNLGVSIGVLADMIDSTQWTTIQQFGLTQGIYFIVCGPAGDNATNAVSTLNTSGAANPQGFELKVIFGNWIYWQDNVNGIQRLVSPTGFAAGLYSNLSPEQSGLNKPLFGISGTQKQGVGAANGTFSEYELAQLFGAGIDVIGNPSPGGNYYSLLLGHNVCTNVATNGDNYSRLTNYFAATLNAGMGIYVGDVINVGLFNSVTSTLNTYLMNAYGVGILSSQDGTLPFSVVCNTTNNPQSMTELGFLTATVEIQYAPINEKFIINLQGGQSVTITRQTTPAGQ